MAGVWFGVSNESNVCIAIVVLELFVILCLSLYLFNPTKDGSGIPEIAGCDVADPEFKRGRISESKSLLNSDSSSLANFLPLHQSGTKQKAKTTEKTYIRQKSLQPVPVTVSEPISANISPVREPSPKPAEKPKTPIALVEAPKDAINENSTLTSSNGSEKRRKSVEFLEIPSEKTESDVNLSVIKEELTREEVTHREEEVTPAFEKIKTEREVITTTKVDIS